MFSPVALSKLIIFIDLLTNIAKSANTLIKFFDNFLTFFGVNNRIYVPRIKEYVKHWSRKDIKKILKIGKKCKKKIYQTFINT